MSVSLPVIRSVRYRLALVSPRPTRSALGTPDIILGERTYKRNQRESIQLECLYTDIDLSYVALLKSFSQTLHEPLFISDSQSVKLFSWVCHFLTEKHTWTKRPIMTIRKRLKTFSMTSTHKISWADSGMTSLFHILPHSCSSGQFRLQVLVFLTPCNTLVIHFMKGVDGQGLQLFFKSLAVRLTF